MEHCKASKYNNQYDEGCASDIDRCMFSVTKYFANSALRLGLPVFGYCSLDLVFFKNQLLIFSIDSGQLLGF